MSAIRRIRRIIPSLAAFFFIPAAATAGKEQALVGQGGTTIPMDKIGAEAQKRYNGGGINITATPEGAHLRAEMQDLEGNLTAEGLWMHSTADEDAGKATHFRIRATAIGRADGRLASLPERGGVRVEKDSAAWLRSGGVAEEFQVSVDGLRQDFVVTSQPSGAGELRVELGVDGASAEATAYGAKLTLTGSGREIAYSRLYVEDANGRELSARLEVLDTGRLALCVADAGAQYPVRIDPTFSDADWVGLNGGVNGVVRAMAMNGSELYLGGDFSVAGSLQSWHVARWTGSGWYNFGQALNGNVYALAMSGGTLYAGGDFTTANGASANRIAKWNGAVWSPLGSGLNGTVNALVVSGNNLYAGGSFTTAGGGNAKNVAKWDGSIWSPLSFGIDGPVNALALNGNDLYAGGSFTSANGMTRNRIAIINVSDVYAQWLPLGSGMNNTVHALALSGGDLYAAGDFTTAGGASANYVAKWNGSTWSPLGSGMNQGVRSLAVNGITLYAGGLFTSAGGTSANHIAKWSLGTWSALASGLNNSVSALAVDSSGHLFAGGSFTYGGSNYVAQANIGRLPAVSIGAANTITYNSASFQGSVNPNGIATTAWLEYGTTPAMGSSSSVTLSPNDGNGAQAVGATITGLQPFTTYYYRLTANSFPGTSVTATQTFKTRPLNELELEAPSGTPVANGTGYLFVGQCAPGQTVTRTITIRSTGPQSLSNISATITGPDAALFSLQSQPPSTIASGASATVTVRFTANATSNGSNNATLSLASNDPDVPFTLALRGFGNLHTDFATPSTIPNVGDELTAADASVGPMTLGFAPTPGTRLTLVKNTGISLIAGQFINLAQGQKVPLTHNGTPYNFIVNYAGGTGNDLVLEWAGLKAVAWGNNTYGKATVSPGAKSNVSAIAAGAYHTLALKNDGSVIAWGANGGGQTNVPPAAQGGVCAIAAGSDHSVALKNDGSVIAWGSNGKGQRTVPPAAQSGVKAIAAGYQHSVALKKDGSVIAWGSNDEGQTTVPPSAQSGVIAIAAGYYTTMALKNNGAVIIWGDYNKFGNAYPVPTEAQSGVIAIAEGSFPISDYTDNFVAIKSDGSVISWGGYVNDWSAPSLPLATIPPAAQSGVVAVSAGHGKVCALKNDGTVVTWILNTSTQTSVPAAAQGGLVAITPGNDHTVALKGDGSVVAWGGNSQGQSTVPEDTQNRVMAISAGLNYSTEIKRDGSVFAWGSIGVTSVPPAAQSGVYAISTGNYHAVALKNDGSLVGWGSNSHGQTTFPVAAQSGACAVAAESYFTSVLRNDGSVITWGVGGYSDDMSYTMPEFQSGVTAIAAGVEDLFALKNDGSVVGWGYWFGGNPIPAEAQSGVTAIASGLYHALALKDDGSVVAWGYNENGQTNVPAAAQSGVVAIAAGETYSLALKNDGTIVGWPNSSPIPAAVQGKAVSVTTGGSHSLALVWGPPTTGFTWFPGITSNGATLYGFVNPNSQFTTARIEYGTTSLLGKVANVALSPADADDAQSVSTALGGLQPGTTYYYRITASNVCGTTSSAIQSFTTLPITNVDIAVEAPSGTLVSNASGTIAFGQVLVGQNPERSVTIRSTGSQSLTSINVSITGAQASQFSVISPPPPNLASGGSNPFTVRFSPTSTGAKSATLRIASNDPDESPFTISLIGTGTNSTTLGQDGNPLQLTWLLNGDLGVSYQGVSGQSYQVQRSMNLVDWFTIDTVVAPANGAVNYTDQNPLPGKAFYRLYQP